MLHMKRYHNDGAQLRKVTDAVGIPPLLSLASLVGEQGDAAGMDTMRYVVTVDPYRCTSTHMTII